MSDYACQDSHLGEPSGGDGPFSAEVTVRATGAGKTMDAQAQPLGGLESGPHYGVEFRLPHFMSPVGSQTLVSYLSSNNHLARSLVSTRAIPRLGRGLQ